MILALKVRRVCCAGFVEHYHLPEALQRVKVERKSHESKPKLMIRLFSDELSVSLPVQLVCCAAQVACGALGLDVGPKQEDGVTIWA